MGYVDMLGLYSMLTREWGVPSALSSTDDGTRALIEIISSPNVQLLRRSTFLKPFLPFARTGAQGAVVIHEELIAEVNDKFSRAGFGFRFDHGMMMKADSQFAHKEIVLPALGVLSDPAIRRLTPSIGRLTSILGTGEMQSVSLSAARLLSR